MDIEKKSNQINADNPVNNETKFQLIDKSLHYDLTDIIWGSNLKEDVFERWSQGFVFSKKEPTALVQLHGGPCAIIAPVQAYLLKDLLFTNALDDWRNVKDDDLNKHLANSFLSIYLNSSSDNSKYLVIYDDDDSLDLATNNNINNTNPSGVSAEIIQDNHNYNPKRIKLDHFAFINKLKFFKCELLNELKEVLYENIDKFRNRYGVLCFLYSIILTKGIETIRSELEEGGDQLIDALHGHGSQSLINLMISGIATSNVFDGEKSLEGLKLHGIPKQSSVGFLTIMEYLRYCEVGWFLKNPKFPIWVLASETHLTVFFSKEQSLVQKDESPRQNAIKNFRKYDTEDSGFVKTEDLQRLMESLDLVVETEYVDIVKLQLDSENLGIITQAAFLNEFYPDSTLNVIPEKFQIYHYNGLARSNKNNEVEFVSGEAALIDFTDQPSTGLNSIKSCIQTKWPTIEINWENDKIPSLN